MDVNFITSNFTFVRDQFPHNGIRKNYFLASCLSLDKDVDLEHINKDCLYGGRIGVGDSRLDAYLQRLKIFRLHAIFHDSTGYMKNKYNIGPGYCYAINCPINSCYVGHVTGLIYCIFLKFCSSFYSKIYC